MLTAVLITAAAQVVTLSANNYHIDEPMPAHTDALLWSDEFDGRGLDKSKWSFDTSRNKAGWYNGELQYYAADRPSNLRLRNGHLIIELRKDPEKLSKLPDWGKQKYSSAKILTKDKVAFNTGFVEVSAKLPCARGTWPAIWMMPQGTAPWPEGGEIDILEQVGSQPNVAHATLHTALFNHVKQTGGRGVWPFDTPFYLILNLAMGGDWAAAKGIDDAALPQRMEVDYVRVWGMPDEAPPPSAER